MKSLINLIISLFFILLLLWYFEVRDNPIDVANNEILEMKSHIGESIIFLEDTVIIVDYSFFKNTYTLSNGTSIGKDLLPKLKRIEDGE